MDEVVLTEPEVAEEAAPQPTVAKPDLRSLHAVEIEHILHVLNNTSGIGEAAEVLGIDAATLYRKRYKYNLMKRRTAEGRVWIQEH